MAVTRAHSCCGVGEVYGVGHLSPQAAVASARSSTYSATIYYSASREITRALEDAGMSVLTSFRNRGSGNTIDVMFRAGRFPPKKAAVKKPVKKKATLARAVRRVSGKRV